MNDGEKSSGGRSVSSDDLADAKRIRQEMQRRVIPSMWTAPQSLAPPPNPAHQPNSNRAAAYFRRVALPHELNGPMPTRGQRIANLAGGIIGGMTCVYLVLFHDFGDRDHVFSPVSDLKGLVREGSHINLQLQVRRFFSLEKFNPMILTTEEKNWAQRKRLGSKADEERMV